MKFLSNLIIISNIIVYQTIIALPSGGLITSSTELPISNENHTTTKFNYASIQSQILATSLLKDSIDIDGNHIYSPLGITTILSILAEGATGQTYHEFIQALGYPESKSELRQSYHDILHKFQQKQSDFMTDIQPTFKTWFYIYRNNTVCPEYRQILNDYYSVQVKDIDEVEFNWNHPDTTISSTSTISSTTSEDNSATISTTVTTTDNRQQDSEVLVNLLTPEKPNKLIENVSPVNSKDILEFEDLKKSEPFDQPNESMQNSNNDEIINEILLNKETSKFDSHVDDKQYVEKPIILNEINQNDQIHSNLNIINDEDNETINDNEKLQIFKKNISQQQEFNSDELLLIPVNSNEPEKITIPIEKLDNIEILENVESRDFKSKQVNQAKSRSLLHKDDIASALSANSITGREHPSKTKMLLFNGLYFRGNWAYPFQELRKPNMKKELFYVTSDVTIPVEMMRTRGIFKIANLQSLDSQAIQLPYENQQYSFVIIVPNEKDGLRKLINTIQPVDIQLLNTQFQNIETLIKLPKFEVEETSRSEGTLKKLGLQKIFSRYSAELNDLSNDDHDLHVEEIVQHVNLRVDEGAATKNSLSVSNPSVSVPGISRSETNKEDDQDELSIVINRPFLYFVLDETCNFVIANGKISAPEIKEQFGLDDDP